MDARIEGHTDTGALLGLFIGVFLMGKWAVLF